MRKKKHTVTEDSLRVPYVSFLNVYSFADYNRPLLFPLDNVEMLILSIIYSFYHWQGTFLGHDYSKLVEANPL